jgi:hypothetical protein
VVYQDKRPVKVLAFAFSEIIISWAVIYKSGQKEELSEKIIGGDGNCKVFLIKFQRSLTPVPHTGISERFSKDPHYVVILLSNKTTKYVKFDSNAKSLLCKILFCQVLCRSPVHPYMRDLRLSRRYIKAVTYFDDGSRNCF